MNLARMMLTFAVLLASSCQTTPNRKLSTRLVWISLDGLTAPFVKEHVAQLRAPHPRGFKFLLAQQNRSDSLLISIPTITAPSHISTITCSPAGQHGIFANGNWDGAKVVSGFEMNYPQETFVHALRTSGARVTSFGYPSIDGNGENRSSDVGVTYDNPKNKGRIFSFAPSNFVTIDIPVRAGEKRRLEATLEKDSAKLQLGATSQTVSDGNWADFYFDDGEATNHIAVLLFKKEDGSFVLYVSPTMKNAAFPPAFRKKLDEAKLVFSPGKDYTLRDELGNAAFMKTMEHRLRYFEKTSRYIADNETADVMFFYFEDLDALGHQFSGDTTAKDLVQAHFERLDRVLGNLISSFDADTHFVIMGDHGMSTIDYEVNVNEYLPSNAQGHMTWISSGGTLLGYRKGQAIESLPTRETWFTRTVQTLRDARLHFDKNKPLFAQVAVKGEPSAKTLGVDGPKMPWIVAVSNPGIRLKQSVEKKALLAKRSWFQPTQSGMKNTSNTVTELPEPVPYGDHGHLSSSTEMRTSLILVGPRFSNVRASEVESNLKVVPLVADAFGWKRPSGCK